MQKSISQRQPRVSARGPWRRQGMLGLLLILALAGATTGCTPVGTTAAPSSSTSTSAVAAPESSPAASGAPSRTYKPMHCPVPDVVTESTPLADMWGILPIAIDASDMEPVGEVITLAHDAAGYTSPTDCRVAAVVPKAQLSTDIASYPVLNRIGPWALISTPARLSLPSEAKGAVNHPAVWVNDADIATAAPALTATVSLSALTVTLPDGSTLPIQAAGTGDLGSTPTGWSSIVSRYQATESASSRCYSEETSVLSSHSEQLDEYAGAPSVIAFHDFSAQCVKETGYTTVSPGCLILDPADLETLNEELPVGSLILINP